MADSKLEQALGNAVERIELSKLERTLDAELEQHRAEHAARYAALTAAPGRSERPTERPPCGMSECDCQEMIAQASELERQAESMLRDAKGLRLAAIRALGRVRRASSK